MPHIVARLHTTPIPHQQALPFPLPFFLIPQQLRTEAERPEAEPTKQPTSAGASAGPALVQSVRVVGRAVRRGGMIRVGK